MLLIVQLGLNFNGQPYRIDLNVLDRSVTLNLVYPPHTHTHHKGVCVCVVGSWFSAFDLMLTPLFEKCNKTKWNFFGDPNFLGTQFFSGPKFLSGLKFLSGTKFFREPNFVGKQIFSGTIFFGGNQICFGNQFLFFGTKFLVDSTFFQ